MPSKRLFKAFASKSRLNLENVAKKKNGSTKTRFKQTSNNKKSLLCGRRVFKHKKPAFRRDFKFSQQLDAGEEYPILWQNSFPSVVSPTQVSAFTFPRTPASWYTQIP